MTRIVRRIVGTSVLVSVLALAGSAEAAGGVTSQRAAAPGWNQVWEMLWQRVWAAVDAALRPAEDTWARKGGGIDPNGISVDEPVTPILTKKGGGIDPNG